MAVAVHALSAWFNGAFLSADEHYQIVEFAQYKLGYQPASSLAWEFGAMIRPALQPWLAAGFIRVCLAVGLSSPFLIAFSMRLLSTLLGLWAALELCARTLPDVRDRSLRLGGLLIALFLWMAPLVEGRFSSENWGGALFAVGLCLMLDAAVAWPERRRNAWLLAACTGLVWSAAFYCRFQIGFAIAGAGMWVLFVRRTPLSLVTAMGAAFLVGCGLNTIVDRWLYGVWVLTPYTYVVVDLMQGKAATFGVSPWWMIAVYLAGALIPPYSVAVLALYVIGAWYARRHVLVWAVVPFVAVHAVVTHKEIRFLLPLVYLAGPLFAVCVDALPTRFAAPLFAWLRTRSGRANLRVLAGANTVLLIVATFLPARENHRLYRWLWDESRDRPMTLYAVGHSPYGTWPEATNSFYRSANVDVRVVASADDLRSACRKGGTLVYYRSLQTPALVAAAAPGCTPVVRTFPAWLPQLDRFHWLADAELSTICRVDAP